MKKKFRIRIVAILALTLCLSTGLASAATKYVDGNSWSYGSTGPNSSGRLYSNYFHKYKLHGSSVKNAYGTVDKDHNVKPGRQSKASTISIPYRTNYAYCNYR